MSKRALTLLWLTTVAGSLVVVPRVAEASLITIRRIVADPARAPYLYVFFDDTDDANPFKQIPLTADKVTLLTKSGAKETDFTVASLQVFKDSHVDLDMVIVVQDNYEYYMPDPKTLSPGAQLLIQSAIGAFVNAIGDRASAALITSGVTIGGQPQKVADFGPIKAAGLAASSINADESLIGSDLHGSLMMALAALATRPAGDRKLVVVLGNGDDLNGSNMSDVIQRAQDASVPIYGVAITTGGIANVALITKLANNTGGAAKIVPDKADPSADATEMGNLIMMQDVATVITGAPTLPDPFAFWNDSDDYFKVKVADGRSEVFTTHVPKAANPISWPKVTWHPPVVWPWVVGFAGGGVLLLGLLIAAARANKEPAEEPVAPAKWKTQAIDLGGGGAVGGVPMVGWIVAMSGDTKGYTYKCQPRTLIGSGPECQVRLNDPFISLKHAEIVCEGGAFKIIDSGSTNGILVNEKKVKAQELVDNDSLRIGKTDFKFKSIN